jgi:hypothetical protein
MLAGVPNQLQAQKAVVKIDSISQDKSIEGKVSNLSDPKNYRVLVYVKTNHWYIHPFAGLGEGRSWAAIKEDGTWRISTEKRQYPANSVAALVVDPETADQAPAETENLEEITNHAVIIYSTEEMRKNGWYEKL